MAHSPAMTFRIDQQKYPAKDKWVVEAQIHRHYFADLCWAISDRASSQSSQLRQFPMI